MTDLNITIKRKDGDTHMEVKTAKPGERFTSEEVSGLLFATMLEMTMGDRIGDVKRTLDTKMSRVEVEHEIEEAIAADREERKLWTRFMNWLRPGRNDF